MQLPHGERPAFAATREAGFDVHLIEPVAINELLRALFPATPKRRRSRWGREKKLKPGAPTLCAAAC